MKRKEIHVIGVPEDVAERLIQALEAAAEESDDDDDDDDEAERASPYKDLDLCEGCEHADTCSEETRAEHREMQRLINEFRRALHGVVETISREEGNAKEFASQLCELSDKSLALAKALVEKSKKTGTA